MTGKDYFDLALREMSKRNLSNKERRNLKAIDAKLRQRAQQEGLYELPLDTMNQLDEFHDRMLKIITQGGLYDH
jgi:hypothetical protein